MLKEACQVRVFLADVCQNVCPDEEVGRIIRKKKYVRV